MYGTLISLLKGNIECNKIEILFSNYIFGLTFQSSSSKKPGIFGIKSLESKSEYIVRK